MKSRQMGMPQGTEVLISNEHRIRQQSSSQDDRNLQVSWDKAKFNRCDKRSVRMQLGHYSTLSSSEVNR